MLVRDVKDRADKDDPGPEVVFVLTYRWAIFGILALGLALVLFHQAAAAAISGHLSREWALDATGLGLLGSVWFLPYALMQIPGGYFADLWGPRKVITGSLAVMSVGALFFASSGEYSGALGARFLVGVGSSLILLPSLKIFAAWFRPREFATVQGLFILAGNLVGGIGATTPLAFISDRFGWRTPMLTVALLSMIATTLTWWIVRDRPRDLAIMTDVNGLDSDLVGQSRGIRNDVLHGSLPWETARFIRGQPSLWISWVILFISFGSFFGVQGLWAGPWLRDVRGLDPVEVGGWLLLLPVGFAFGTLVFGYVSDRIVGRRRPLIIVGLASQGLLWVLLIVFLAHVPHGIGQVLFLLLGFAMGGTMLVQVVIKEICPFHLFGSIFGVMNTAAFIGSAAFQLVTGWLLGLTDPVSLSPDPVYSATAYGFALAPVGTAALTGVIFSRLLPETLSD